MLYKKLGAVAVLATLMAPGTALAASAIATADVNLRAGPSTGYPVVNVVGSGHNVEVLGCLSNRSWCDVSYGRQRGWISSNYLAFFESGRRYTGAGAIVELGTPTITFSFGSYWDNHYRGRHFYRDRDHWKRGHWDRDRRDRDYWDRDRWERRDLKDARRNMREARRELREERRELRQARRRFMHERRDWRN